MIIGSEFTRMLQHTPELNDSYPFIDAYMNEVTYKHRLESYDIPKLKEYIKRELSDFPTVISWLYGTLKLIRALPYPYHNYHITHDGLIHTPSSLTLRDGIAGDNCRIPIFVAEGVTGSYEVVRLMDCVGNVRPFAVHRLVAKTFMPYSTHERIVDVFHINGETFDNHVQNLKIIVKG